MSTLDQITEKSREIRKIGDPQVILAEFIHPDPSQPRQDFYNEPVPQTAIRDLRDLANSIDKQGLINPILISVSFKDSEGKIHYKIVDGERRYRAITDKKYGLGHNEILAQIIEIQDPISLDLIRLTVQQTSKNWSPYDQANAERGLIEKLGGNVSAVSKLIGVSRQSIINHQIIFRLAPNSLSTLKDNGVQLTYAREAAKLISLLTEYDKANWPDYEKIIIDKIITGKIETRDDLMDLNAAIKPLETGQAIKKEFFEDPDYTAKNAAEMSGVGSKHTVKDAEIKARKLVEIIDTQSDRLKDSESLKVAFRTLSNRISTFLTIHN